MEKFCISLDWLQTFCHGNPIKEGEYTQGVWVFYVQQIQCETAVYKKVFTVQSKGKEVATILQEPRNSCIHKRATSVKIANRCLYCEQYIDLLYNLQKALGLIYKGITRLDICYDCNLLHGGRKVERFLRQFICNDAFAKGHIIRSGSSRFTVNGTRRASSSASFNSVRFGSRNNDIGAYCYDKTLELIEVKDKPWIREMWEKNGLRFEVDEHRLDSLSEKEREKAIENDTLSEYVRHRVWRFEISIKSGGTDILNMASGELFRLSPSYLEHYEKVCHLFYLYAAKVFDFRIYDGVPKIRKYKPLRIFETGEQVTEKPVHLSRAADTGRMEKICYNKLKKLASEYADLSLYHQDGLTAAMGFLLEVSGYKEGIYRMTRQIHCLDHFTAYKFSNYEELIYFDVLEELGRKKQDYDFTPDDIYHLIKQLEPMTIEEAEYLYNAVPLPIDIQYQDQDLTPLNYPYGI